MRDIERFDLEALSPGIALRTPHLEEILACRPDLGWLEAHPENYIDDPGAVKTLERVAHHYPLSLHGVGLSLGSALDLDRHHLALVSSLVERLEPVFVSEHLSWSATGGIHLNELLPLPYTEESLDVMTSHTHQVQECLRRPILIENPSSYLRFRHSTLSEAEFLAELVRRTACGLLVDVNNLYVSAHNVGIDPREFLSNIPREAVREFHIAGHARNTVGEKIVLIDDHGSRVCKEVWALYAEAVERFGYRSTLVEWDANLPALEVLIDEATRARRLAADLFDSIPC